MRLFLRDRVLAATEEAREEVVAARACGLIGEGSRDGRGEAAAEEPAEEPAEVCATGREVCEDCESVLGVTVEEDSRESVGCVFASPKALRLASAVPFAELCELSMVAPMGEGPRRGRRGGMRPRLEQSCQGCVSNCFFL